MAYFNKFNKLGACGGGGGGGRGATIPTGDYKFCPSYFQLQSTLDISKQNLS